MAYAICFDDALTDLDSARFDTVKSAKTVCGLLGLESAFIVRVKPNGQVSRLTPAKRIRAIGSKGIAETVTVGEACKVLRALMANADKLSEQYPHASDPVWAAYDDENIPMRTYLSLARRVAESDMRAESIKPCPDHVAKMQMLYARDKAEDIDTTHTERFARKVDRLRAIRYARTIGVCTPAMDAEYARIIAKIDVEPSSVNGAEIENALHVNSSPSVRHKPIARCGRFNVFTESLENVPSGVNADGWIDASPTTLARVAIGRDKRMRREIARKGRIAAEREYRRIVYARKESLPIASALVRKVFPSNMPETLQWPIECAADVADAIAKTQVEKQRSALFADHDRYEARKRTASVREHRRLTGIAPSVVTVPNRRPIPFGVVSEYTPQWRMETAEDTYRPVAPAWYWERKRRMETPPSA